MDIHGYSWYMLVVFNAFSINTRVEGAMYQPPFQSLQRGTGAAPPQSHKNVAAALTVRAFQCLDHSRYARSGYGWMLMVGYGWLCLWMPLVGHGSGSPFLCIAWGGITMYHPRLFPGYPLRCQAHNSMTSHRGSWEALRWSDSLTITSPQNHGLVPVPDSKWMTITQTCRMCIHVLDVCTCLNSE